MNNIYNLIIDKDPKLGFVGYMTEFLEDENEELEFGCSIPIIPTMQDLTQSEVLTKNMIGSSLGCRCHNCNKALWGFDGYVYGVNFRITDTVAERQMPTYKQVHLCNECSI